MEIVFSIGAALLHVRNDVGENYVVPASSGRHQCLNNPSDSCLNSPGQGAIPLGQYYLDPGEMSDPGVLWDILRNTQANWGDFRIRIHAEPSTRTGGRSEFFLHGGNLDGSKGCIDAGGGIMGDDHTDRLVRNIRHSPGFVRLTVIR